MKHRKRGYKVRKRKKKKGSLKVWDVEESLLFKKGKVVAIERCAGFENGKQEETEFTGVKLFQVTSASLKNHVQISVSRGSCDETDPARDGADLKEVEQCSVES